jgi:hypothetical protein
MQFRKAAEATLEPQYHATLLSARPCGAVVMCVRARYVGVPRRCGKLGPVP